MVSVRSASAVGGNGVSSVTLTKPTGVAVGDLLFLVAHNDPDGAVTSITAPAGFVRVTGAAETTADYDNAGGKGKLWYKIVTSGDVSAINYSIGMDSNTSSIAEMLCITGQAANDIFNTSPAFGTNPVTDTTHIAPSVTPTVDNCLLVCNASAFGSGARTYTPPAGMVEQTDQQADPVNYLWSSIATQVLSGGANVATGTRAFTPSDSTALSANTFSLAIAPLPQVPVPVAWLSA